jgi:hypothetical protein
MLIIMVDDDCLDDYGDYFDDYDYGWWWLFRR